MRNASLASLVQPPRSQRASSESLDTDDLLMYSLVVRGRHRQRRVPLGSPLQASTKQRHQECWKEFKQAASSTAAAQLPPQARRLTVGALAHAPRP